MHNTHILMCDYFKKHAQWCELLQLHIKSVLHCCLPHLMFCFVSSPPAAMEESSSVYMCFPCYKEFNTLEEVLKHQLTCVAEEEPPDTSGTTNVTLPVLQTQVIPGTVNIFIMWLCSVGLSAVAEIWIIKQRIYHWCDCGLNWPAVCKSL